MNTHNSIKNSQRALSPREGWKRHPFVQWAAPAEKTKDTANSPTPTPVSTFIVGIFQEGHAQQILRNSIFLLLFLGNTFAFYAQTNPPSHWKYLGSLPFNSNSREIWTTDVLGNVFITSNGVLTKYDSTGTATFSQSIKAFGKLKDVQAINTMKIVTFSEEQQTVCVLDNTLTLSENCVDLSNYSIQNASHIAVSSQSDKLWVVDQLNSTLLLLNLNATNQSQEVKNLKGILNIATIKSIQEADNNLFLIDSKGNLYQFDMYGSLISMLEIGNNQCIGIKNNALLILSTNQLHIESLNRTSKKTVDLPVPSILSFQVSGDFFYFQTVDKIYKYTLHTTP
jgi:hypothetical protein